MASNDLKANNDSMKRTCVSMDNPNQNLNNKQTGKTQGQYALINKLNISAYEI